MNYIPLLTIASIILDIVSQISETVGKFDILAPTATPCIKSTVPFSLV